MAPESRSAVPGTVRFDHIRPEYHLLHQALIMGVGLARYTSFSVLAAAAVIYHAFATREQARVHSHVHSSLGLRIPRLIVILSTAQFYPACVFLSTSKIAVAVMGNLGFATAMCLQKVVIQIFLGTLRDLEIEMIRERLSSTVMESLLALTIFREEFGTFFVSMFAALVFVKVMHWLVQDRVDYVEVTPSVSRLTHVRLVALMSALLVRGGISPPMHGLSDTGTGSTFAHASPHVAFPHAMRSFPCRPSTSHSCSTPSRAPFSPADSQ